MQKILYIDVIDGVTFTLADNFLDQLIDGLKGVESDVATTYSHPQGAYIIVILKNVKYD
jgi:hypothetical protein